jgi:hypothetical protein
MKRYDNNFFFTPLFYCCFWIRDPGWVKIRIWDKHPGSATLQLTIMKPTQTCIFRKKSIFCNIKPLKVDGNKKQWGPGRRQMLGNGLGLWRSRFIFNLNIEEIRFSMENGTFKIKMDIDSQDPRLMPNNCKNLTHLNSRYHLPLKHLKIF